MILSTENIVLNNIIQNLLNLRGNYPGRFLHLSLLLISIYTIHLFEKLVKRNLQEESQYGTTQYVGVLLDP